MLRALVVALLVVNLLFFAWTRGWLDPLVGARPTGDREPERLERQVHPERVRILPPGTPSDPVPVAAGCFEAGPFADGEVAAAQTAAQAALPPGSWSTVRTEVPGSWIVYMGRFASRDAESKKEDELSRRQVSYREIADPPPLAPGLSLGRFEVRGAAEQALGQLTQQGIRTARVVELSPPTARTVLRIDKATATLTPRLAALGRDAIAGKGFAACSNAAPGG